MRMMKNKENQIITVIGVDHGYGNLKTACRCFQAGVTRYEKEPTFQNNLLCIEHCLSLCTFGLHIIIGHCIGSYCHCLRRIEQIMFRIVFSYKSFNQFILH